MRKKILLLSGYDAASHKLWRERLALLFPEHEWKQLALPPRHFNWRIRSNSLQWASTHRSVLIADYDLLLVTSMVDLSSLRGFVPEISKLPTAIYFHENQFVYPPNSQEKQNIEPLLVPLYAAICADRIIFNSDYNRDTFLQGVRNLLKQLPEKIPIDVFQKLENSDVIPVPLANVKRTKLITSKNQLDIVWNHRWEYDKGPELLLHLINEVDLRSLPIRFHIVGEQFRHIPKAFRDIQLKLKSHAARLGLELGAFGYVNSRLEYHTLLQSSDLVLSTALHDFQGLAIQEACLAGCSPITPRALVYPEYIPENCMYGNSGSGKEQAVEIVELLINRLRQKQEGSALPQADLKNYSGQTLRNKYNELLNNLALGRKSTQPVLKQEI